MAALRQIPTMVILERLPVPALAVDRAGTVLFLNTAFCDMVGYASDELLPEHFEVVFHGMPADHRWGALVEGEVPRLVELRHKSGYAVWAGVKNPAMRSGDETAALVILYDRTEELWLFSDVPQPLPEAPVGNPGSEPAGRGRRR